MEVLIRVVDKGVAEDCSKAGDVISICPNGWAWSPHELSNPEWRIVRVPILQANADAFLARSAIAGVTRRREWKIDFSLLPNPALFTGTRTEQITALTRPQVVAAAVRKP